MSYWVVSGVVKKVWIAKKSQSPMTTSTKLSDPWISVLRSAVRSTMGEAGWKVGPSRAGKVFLQKVDLAPRGEKRPSVTVSLPYSWDESSVPAVITRCQAIQKVMALQEAQQLARYMHGPHWGEQNDAAVENYLKQNGFG